MRLLVPIILGCNPAALVLKRTKTAGPRSEVADCIGVVTLAGVLSMSSPVHLPLQPEVNATCQIKCNRPGLDKTPSQCSDKLKRKSRACSDR